MMRETEGPLAEALTFMHTMLPVSAPAAKKLYTVKPKNRFIRAMLSEKAHLHVAYCETDDTLTLSASGDQWL